MVAGGIVLLVACDNVAGLLLVRAGWCAETSVRRGLAIVTAEGA